MTSQKQTALEWLESLPEPAIAAPSADMMPAPVSYVPPGDIIGRKGKKGAELYEHPVYRWRQPRHFPSAVILGEPAVCYGWEKDPDHKLLEVLDDIASGVSHLGTSHSLVVVSAHPGRMPGLATLIPDGDGTEFLRVPVCGRLKELDEVFQQAVGVRRPTPMCERLASYRTVRAHPVIAEAPSSEFIVLRIESTMHGVDTAAYLGRTFRRAVMSVLGDECPASVHGHNGGTHIGWLPLPDVGHVHAKGRILGLGVMIPPELDARERSQVLKAVGMIRELRLPDGRRAQLSIPRPGERTPVALTPQTWTLPCSAWATVTPVILDRPPKKLSEERLRDAFLQSLDFAGYPEPLGIELSSFSVFQGAPAAFRVPTTKPRYHATVHFEAPVAGPLIAGRSRYFGIGLFRPLPSLDHGNTP